LLVSQTQTTMSTTIIAFDNSKDYYDILGISVDTIGCLDDAFAKLSRRWAVSSTHSGKTFFKLGGQAYATLSNPISKAAYDAARTQRMILGHDSLPCSRTVSPGPDPEQLLPWTDNVEEWELSREVDDIEDGWLSSATIESSESSESDSEPESPRPRAQDAKRSQRMKTTEVLTPPLSERGDQSDSSPSHPSSRCPPLKPALECVFSDYFHDDFTERPLLRNLRRRFKEAQAAWRHARDRAADSQHTSKFCLPRSETAFETLLTSRSATRSAQNVKWREARAWQLHLSRARKLKKRRREAAAHVKSTDAYWRRGMVRPSASPQ
jgi:curved DNA-binding protein CbpA